jgi:DNA-binding NtrC family response regulator
MKNEIATKQVMLIFDEFSFSDSLLVLLAAEGYQVILARNEEQVHDELLSDPKPDLVLLEVQLNTIKILQIIQSVQPRIPVIVMAEPSLLNLALEIKKEFGAWEAVVKPLDFSVLRELLQHALGDSHKAA